MTDSDEQVRLLALLRLRERQCFVEHRAYGKWLKMLTPLRWFTAGFSTILSALAGATILSASTPLDGQRSTLAGRSALAASILSGLHIALKCDAHQAECRRLIQLYQSLETGFQASRALPASELPQRFKELEARFEEAKLKATAAPPTSFRRRAENEVSPAV